MKTKHRKIQDLTLPADVHQTLAWLLPLAAFCILFTFSNPTSAQIWTPTSAPQDGWASVASSADGTKLVAAGDDVYISTNSGSTWSLSLAGVGDPNWNGIGAYDIVASSTNGSRLVVVNDLGIFTSANSGASWATNTSLSGMSWQGLASSADGTKLVAVALEDQNGNPGPIYVSTNSGSTWTLTSAPTNSWSSVACSANGSVLVAAVSDDPNINNYNAGPIYVSTDSGNTWNPTAPNCHWTSVACSTDGTRMAAVASSGAFGFLVAPVYTSMNSGTTWVANPATTNLGGGYEFGFVVSSANGMNLTALGIWFLASFDNAPYTGVMLTSTNAGTNWTPTATVDEGWLSAACSADGTKVVAASSSEIFTDAAATPWVRSSAPGTNSWSSIAASADGTKLAASAGYSYFTGSNGPVYLSTNAGSTWVTVPALNTNDTVAVASSADGTKLAAISANQYIEISTNSGTTWGQATLPAANWSSAALSSNGNTLVAAGGNTLVAGPLYVSTNSGGTWVAGGGAPTAGGWSSVACSWDGTKMVAAQCYSSFTTPPYSIYPGYIYTSTNSGNTWNRSSAHYNLWVSVACSADGTHIVALSQPMDEFNTQGLIYFSTNSGLTWSSNNVANTSWASAASSADGTKFVAVDGAGLVLLSTNSGTTWATNLESIFAWQPVAMAGNGSEIIVGALVSGSIYISQFVEAAGPPSLNISLSGNEVFLSWPTNATGCILQQNTNLLTTNWLTVTNLPVVTNMSYRVTVPPANRQNFYRLEIP